MPSNVRSASPPSESTSSPSPSHLRTDEMVAEGDEKDGSTVEKGHRGPVAADPDESQDPKLVTWNGPDDPENPKNWPNGKKWTVMTIVSVYTFVSPVSSTMVAPALSAINAEFNVHSEVVSQLILTLFILAFAVGPLFLGPLSEEYGRAIVLQLANLFYLAFNIGCGFSKNTGQILAFRFLSGLGGSVPLAVGGGVLGDCFKPEQRGGANAVFALAPLLGPAIGPIVGGFISERTTWRWVFYSTSILTGIVQVLGFFFLHETFGPRLLRNRAERLRRETGDLSYQTQEERLSKTFVQSLQASLIRPFKLLGTQPIIQVLALYMAYIYGLMYLMLGTFPLLWTSPHYYHESPGIAGLNYIALGLGSFLGAFICAVLNDAIYVRLKTRNNNEGMPEYRIPLLCLAAFFIPTGLFIYGWTAQTHQHWIAPNIGACLFAMANMATFQVMQTYIVDTYTLYAASAMAAVSVLRSLAAFSFPLFAPYMYKALEYGWGNSVLAFISIAIGIPSPIFLWVFGAKLRKASPYAAGGG